MAKWDAWSSEPLYDRIDELEDENLRYREALEGVLKHVRTHLDPSRVFIEERILDALDPERD